MTTPHEPRRMAAGHAVLVVVGALVLASLLDAHGLRRTAEQQPFGWRRTIGVAITKPLTWVAGAFGLDRPRAAMDRALGHELAGERRATAVLPVAVTRTPPTSVAPRAPTPAAPLRLWIVGDSMAQVFGESLVNAAVDSSVVAPTLDYHISTGLSRPDYFDWPAHVAEELPTLEPEVVVAMFGANDAQGLILDGSAVPYGSPTWREEYGRRVGVLMDLLSAGGRPVLWVAQPPMRSESYSAKMADLNAVYEAEARRRPAVTFVDTSRVLGSEGGGWTPYLPGSDGRTLARQADGIHLSRAGGDHLAAVVLDRIRTLWDGSAREPRVGTRR